MASSSLHRRRNSLDVLPPYIADVVRFKNEFLKLYARDHPQLQQCIKRLHNSIKTFESAFKVSTEGSKDAGVKGIIGGTALVAGIGLGVGGVVLAPFTLGASFAIAAAGVSVGVGGAGALTVAGIQSNRCSSEKNYQMKRLRQDIEAELKEFQDKINPMAEKIKDLHEQTEKILRDFQKLEQDASDFSKIQLEDIAKLNRQMSENNLVLDMTSIKENTKALNDMEKLAETPIHEEIDERKIRSKAGKFLAEMRKLINRLQNIIDDLEKTKTQTIRI